MTSRACELYWLSRDYVGGLPRNLRAHAKRVKLLLLIPGAVDQLQSAICCGRQNRVWVAASSLELLLCEEKSLYRIWPT